MRTDGVSYAQTAHAPSWLLRDRAGEPIRCAWLSLPVGDGYRQPRLSAGLGREVVHELESQGWDGVFIDNVNPTIRYYHDPADVAQYPTTRPTAAAMTSAPRATSSPRSTRRASWRWPTSAPGPTTPPTGARWLRRLDGAMDERFAKFTAAPGGGTARAAEWRTELSILQQASARASGSSGIAAVKRWRLQAERFGWATMLLGSGGHATFALQNDANYGVETWFPDYEAPIGHAARGRLQRRSGVELRRFSHGLVLVNPTAAAHSATGWSLLGRWVATPVRPSPTLTSVTPVSCSCARGCEETGRSSSSSHAPRLASRSPMRTRPEHPHSPPRPLPPPGPPAALAVLLLALIRRAANSGQLAGASRPSPGPPRKHPHRSPSAGTP